MRATRVIFIVLGWLFLIGGLAMAGIAAQNRDDVGMLLGLAVGASSVAAAGLVFLLVARYFKNFLGAAALDEPVAGTALVVTATDTGATINNVNAVLKVHATITVPGHDPYDGMFRIAVGRTQWGAIQPGMTLPVLVERNDPTKIVHDPSRPAVAVSTVIGQAGGAVMSQTMSAADVIARGIPSQGVLEAADPTGLIAGQVLASLPNHEADDPLVRVVFAYTPSGSDVQRAEILVRVPDGKGQWLQPGETLPIAYLPDDPTTATIDWSRL